MMFDVSSKYAKNVSGFYFFTRLIKRLQQHRRFSKNANTVLVNVSVPICHLIWLWAKGKVLVIRLDGAYHDSIAHLEDSNHRIFKGLGKRFPDSTMLNFLFNFLYENWKVQLRLMFCSAVVYQSEFSRRCNEQLLWVRKKTFKVIPNAYPFAPEIPAGRDVAVFVGDDYRKNSKASIDHALNYCLKNDLRLQIVGWQPKFEGLLSSRLSDAISHGKANLAGRYGSLDQLRVVLNGCAYLVFLSYRDPCPNFLLEAISFGLMPVCIDSGGVAEILPPSYPLVQFVDTFKTYSPSRFSQAIPPVSYNAFAKTFDDIRRLEPSDVVLANLSENVVSEHYAEFLSSLGSVDA